MFCSILWESSMKKLSKGGFVEIAEIGNFKIWCFYTRSNETQLSKDEKMVFLKQAGLLYMQLSRYFKVTGFVESIRKELFN